MRLYVGLVTRAWLRRMRASRPADLVVWTAAARGFRALRPGEPFLCKLHAPDHALVGGGWFVRALTLPASLLWMAFGPDAGADDPAALLAAIDHDLRAVQGEGAAAATDDDRPPADRRPADPDVHAVLLTRPFWLADDAWLPMPADWHPFTAHGRAYDVADGVGRATWEALAERLPRDGEAPPRPESAPDERAAWALAGLGPAGFRALVADAYGRRCAITGERGAALLEATHLRPVSRGGAHRIANGVLLRADLRRAFDQGLLAIAPSDLRVRVAPALRREGAGGGLAGLHGRPLRVLPQRLEEMPDRGDLAFHATHVYRG